MDAALVDPGQNFGWMTRMPSSADFILTATFATNGSLPGRVLREGHPGCNERNTVCLVELRDTRRRCDKNPSHI